MMNLDSLDPRLAALLGGAGVNPLMPQTGAAPLQMPGNTRVNMAPPQNSWSGDEFRVGAFPQAGSGAGPVTGVAPPPVPPKAQPGPMPSGGGGSTQNPLMPGMPASAVSMPAGRDDMRLRMMMGGGGNPFLAQKF